MSEFRLDFHDTATAFADKSDSQLKEKYRIFRMLNSPFMNAIGRGRQSSHCRSDCRSTV
jgi:hypothetical protein